MQLQAWEERAGAVFWEAVGHEDGQATPDRHADSLRVAQMQSQIGCRAELDVCCNPAHSGQVALTAHLGEEEVEEVEELGTKE